ncbi:MAG: hypothetical protein KDB88_06775 [Flavobacteriales bacterium]|nr:hypothetical protein [Flavobacteriales bacterium]
MSLAPAQVDAHVALALRDLPRVEEHLERRGRPLQGAVHKDPELAGIEQHFRYSYKGRDWYCVLQVGATEQRHGVLMHWFTYVRRKGYTEALHAVQPRPGERSLYFDTHFFSRWGLRNDELRVKVTNMQGFLRQYPALELVELGTLFRGRPAMVAAIDHGLIHGAMMSDRTISCDTFISLAIMREHERMLWDRLRGEQGK